jgi:hypothetical protein
MIACHHNHGLLLDAWQGAALDTCNLNGELLKLSQAPGWLGKVLLSLPRLLHRLNIERLNACDEIIDALSICLLFHYDCPQDQKLGISSL